MRNYTGHIILAATFEVQPDLPLDYFLKKNGQIVLITSPPIFVFDTEEDNEKPIGIIG